MLKIYRAGHALIFALLFLGEAAQQAPAATTAPPPPAPASRTRALGTIVGSVRDQSGKPLAGALVVVLREGAEEIIKEARTGIDGQFVARLAAGRYALRAVAAGFNPAGFASVQLTPSSELVYRFNLEPAGDGRTAPERRNDRDETKWRLRAAQSRRSIFQINEGPDETVAAVQTAADEVESTPTYIAGQPTEVDDPEDARRARPQGVIETYAAASANPFLGNYAGTNFAVAQAISDELSLILAGQIGYGGAGAPQRFEATARLRVGDDHRLSVSGGGMRVGGATATAGGAVEGLTPALPASGADFNNALGQISFGAYDEWNVRDGVIVVLGVDYARFTGAGVGIGEGGDALRPRLGLQYDLDARTRLRAAYAPGASDGGAAPQGAAQFEDETVIFNEAHLRPVATNARNGRPVMENSRRLEIGLERVLDSRSSVEATAFLDTFDGRGVGLMSLPVTAFAGDSSSGVGDEFLQIAQQQGAARGLRLLYSRRFGPAVKASVGYSFGRGQALAPAGINDPSKLWRGGFFQTAAAQIETTLPTKTRVRTVFRFSPRATVFAIDPFAGRLAVFDPSLSFFVTQELPAFGLPVRVEAVLDARNLLDAPAGAIEDGETVLLVGAARRSVRGGISLRF